MSWRDYWNSDTPIYVNARHKDVHYRRIADDIGRLLAGQNLRLLDYGCGEALSADRLAAQVEHLYLCDGADLVRHRLTDRLRAFANVTVLAPEELDAVADGSIDLIVVNSVVQYVSREDLTDLMAQWRLKLADTGRLVIADVLPHNLSPLTDALALLRFAAGNGFLCAAILGLGKTFFSDYRRVRSALGLTHYDENEMLALLRRSGFSAERLDWNLGHNPARMAFSATPTSHATPAT
jgi:SAM-dependent methyltransferase